MKSTGLAILALDKGLQQRLLGGAMGFRGRVPELMQSAG